MKKTFYKILSFLGVTTLIFLAYACLKDDRFVDFSAVGSVIEFPDAAPGKALGVSFAALSDTPDTVWIRVNQTGPYATTKDLSIGLGISQAGLDVYNQDTSHVVGTLLPDTSYVLPATVTIKAGKDTTNISNRAGLFMLLLYSKKVPSTAGVNYVLPVGITSVPPGFIISGNYGAILYNFYHNPYDGDYTSAGTRYNFNVAGDYAGWNVGTNSPAAGSVIASSSPWVFPSSPVVTVNATISTVHCGNLNGGFGYMNIKVNPADNTVLIISTADTGLNALIPLQGSGAPASTWNPGTKVLDLYYQYTNTTGTFRVLHQVMTHN